MRPHRVVVIAAARLSSRVAVAVGVAASLALTTTLYILVPAQAANRKADTAKIALVTHFAFDGVKDVVPSSSGLYVLRQVEFPGDTSDIGWEVDLVNSTSGHVTETASGDADPESLVVAFGSVWVSTGSGAMPGGLGPGIDRLGATTLNHQARLNVASLTAIAATSSNLWILEVGDTPHLESLDPATNAITQTKSFATNDLVEALTTTRDRVDVGYEPFDHPPAKKAHTKVMSIDPSSLKTLSDAVVGQTSSAAGAADGVYSLAANESTLYVGLESVRIGSSLVVLRSNHVVGSDRGAGDLVTASPSGVVWADAIHRHKDGTDTSDIERIANNGAVISRLGSLPTIVSISAVGHVLYAGTSEGVLVFKG